MLPWILDILVVLILLLGFLIGGKRGLFNILFKRLRKIMAIVFVILLSKPLGKWIADAIISPTVTKWVASGIEVDPALLETGAEGLLTAIPAWVKDMATAFQFDLHALAEEAIASGGDVVNEIVFDLIQPLTRGVGVVIAGIVLYLVLGILLRFCGGIINNIFKLPILKQVNSILGAVTGCAMAFLVTWCLLKLFGILVSTETLRQMEIFRGFEWDQCLLSKYLYRLDLIHFLLSLQNYL